MGLLIHPKRTNQTFWGIMYRAGLISCSAVFTSEAEAAAYMHQHLLHPERCRVVPLIGEPHKNTFQKWEEDLNYRKKK